MSMVYEAAAHTLHLLEAKQGSLKQLCFQLSQFARPVYALLIKLLSVKGQLDALLRERWDNCEEREKALVMLYDYLTAGKIRSGGGTKREIVKRFADVPKLKQVKATGEGLKWVRANPFLTSTSELKAALCGTDDPDIPGLLQVSETNLQRYKDSAKVIQQDKASCMPVAALNLKPGRWSAFDACSAPGNKTLQLAGRMLALTSGKLFAFERDSARFSVLIKRLEQYKASNVTPIQQDFLSIHSLPAGVRYGVVDPSCSGSGIAEHHLVDSGKLQYCTTNTNERVRRLAAFQRKVLHHALLLSDLHEVVYSTCSLYIEENEEVVRDTLKSLGRFYRLSAALPGWKRRGIDIKDFSAEKCARTDPIEDKLTGFFVALFRRKMHRVRHRLLSHRSLTFTMYRSKYHKEAEMVELMQSI
jgi:16S rRNA C967 or C1407 C5-methylase (RsmB/RsmF family)